MSNVTVKAKIEVVPPPPPKSVVVITMEFHDAILLRDDIRAAITASDVQRFGLNRLINELDQLDLK